MVVPSSTFPQRCDVPATWSRELTSWVLPASPCPITARFRMFSVVNDFIWAPYLVQSPKSKVQSRVIDGLWTLDPRHWTLCCWLTSKSIVVPEKGQDSDA